MRLSELLKDYLQISPDFDCQISCLTLDSRKVQKGDLFLAVKGTQIDGIQFIADAIAKDAVAVLKEAEFANEKITFLNEIPIVPIKELSQKISHIAGCFYRHPANQLEMIGITGTNGKTSCSHFLAQSLQGFNAACGIIGTLGSGFYGKLQETGLTTPDAITLQKNLHDLLQQGARAVAMEVSSHSIDQGRINDIHFKIGIFTNLTQDHLDYHGDMATYAAVKRKFLASPQVEQVIINIDDPYGLKWAQELSTIKPVFTYGIQSGNTANVYAKNIHFSDKGIEAFIVSPWGEGELYLPLIGQFNLSNALATLTALCVLKVPLNNALKQMEKLYPVAGRMQLLHKPDKPLIVVDYAHTPDALEKVLQALRDHTEGELTCVFGCGGDRDQSKRPLMARVVEKFAKHIWVTSDNPRHESPTIIAEQILQGFTKPECVNVELDRSKAIQNSIQLARVGDCVLIAGKGAEHYQQIGDQKIPFDDVEKVKECLQV